MKGRFKSLSIIIPIEYDSIFFGLARVDAHAVMRMISRDSAVKLASLLKREYCGQPAPKIAQLLSSGDPHFVPLLAAVKQYSDRMIKENGAEVVVAFDITPLELLRIACSIPPEDMREVSPSRRDELQWRITKLITQINQRLMGFKAPKATANDVAKLLLVNDASYKDIHKTDLKGEFIIQPIQAVLFFQLLESNERYTGLLNAFCNFYGIGSWREYVKTIYSLALQSYKMGNGLYPVNMVEKNAAFLSKSVIDRISIDANAEVLPYANSDEYDSEGNSDYREFKGRPLFKLSNGDYVIHNQTILIDRLYQGLYFDFQHIATKLSDRHPDVSNLFTSAFIEKTLFVGTVRDCICRCRYVAFDEEKLAAIHKINQGELGYPDYIIKRKSNKSIILFECKDIRLNAWIKEQRDYDLLERELKNKIVRKTYTLDKEHRCHKDIPSPKRIGVGQLAGHTASIRNKSFPWNPELKDNVKIYPILVIADNRLIYEGLPRLAQQWYKDCLVAEGVNNMHNERPLIMISPLTFIKYKKRFLRYGFEHYFELYYKAISQRSKSKVNLFNQVMSFDTFMEQYSYSLSGLRKMLMKTIFAK